jgi:hypothetical protein
LEQEPESKDKEKKKILREQKKQIRKLESHRDKLMEYDKHLEIMGERNSYSGRTEIPPLCA